MSLPICFNLTTKLKLACLCRRFSYITKTLLAGVNQPSGQVRVVTNMETLEDSKMYRIDTILYCIYVIYVRILILIYRKLIHWFFGVFTVSH